MTDTGQDFEDVLAHGISLREALRRLGGSPAMGARLYRLDRQKESWDYADAKGIEVAVNRLTPEETQERSDLTQRLLRGLCEKLGRGDLTARGFRNDEAESREIDRLWWRAQHLQFDLIAATVAALGTTWRGVTVFPPNITIGAPRPDPAVEAHAQATAPQAPLPPFNRTEAETAIRVRVRLSMAAGKPMAPMTEAEIRAELARNYSGHVRDADVRHIMKIWPDRKPGPRKGTRRRS